MDKLKLRKYMKNNTSKTSLIIIVASPNVQDNFRLQLFDKSKFFFFIEFNITCLSEK